MPASKEDLFTEVLNTNKEKIFRICNSFADDYEQAKDLAQEVFLNIWKSLGSFRGDSHINTWVYRITLNICLRAKTNLRSRNNDIVSLDGIEFQHFPDPGDTRKDFSRLYACIRSLNTADRTIILLYLEELPYKEIAGICGISENYVAVKIKRIKAKLLTCLTGGNYEK